jgi:REP element-mobilizing transposase RayT
MKIDYYTPFYSNQFYHIYNRGNNGEKIFYTEENHAYFLRRFDHYISNYADTYAYCLLPNHFHFLIKVIDKNKLVNQLRLFFLSYSKAINQQTGRKGSLFQKRFKRTINEDNSSLIRATLNIHSNPVHHEISADFRKYMYSSYLSLMSDKRTKLKREEVFKWFGGRESFIKAHLQKLSEFDSDKFFLED